MGYAVTSAEDQGEAAVEQFYVERVHAAAGRRAGLFLIPSGMLNTAHEPTQYFGVTRDFVNTSIIPTTWREGGVALTGVTDYDLTWDVRHHDRLQPRQLGTRRATRASSPLGSIHQELQLAKAANLSAYGALNWRGVPGLLVGGSVFAGKAGQDQPNFPSQNAVVTLAEGTRAGRRGRSTCRRSTPTATSATPPPTTRPSSAADAGARGLTAGRCSVPGTHGAAATTSSHPSFATSASTPAGGTRRSPTG